MFAQFSQLFINGSPRSIEDIKPEQIDSIGKFAEAVKIFHLALSAAQDPITIRIRTTLIRFEAFLWVWGNSLRVISDFSQVSNPLESDLRDLGSIHYFFSIPATWEINETNAEEIKIALSIVAKMKGIFTQMLANPLLYIPTLFRALLLMPFIEREYLYKVRDLFQFHLTKQDSALALFPARIHFFESIQKLSADNPESHQAVCFAFDELIQSFTSSFNYIEIFSPHSHTHVEDVRQNEDGLGVEDERNEVEERQTPHSRNNVNELDSLLNDMSMVSDIETRLQRTYIRNMLQNITLCISLKSLFSKGNGFALSKPLVTKVNQVIDQINQNNHFEFRGRQYNLLNNHSEYKEWFAQCGLSITDSRINHYEKPTTNVRGSLHI